MNMVQRMTLRVGGSLFVFALNFALGQVAFAESTPRFDGRTFGIEMEGEYFNTTENLSMYGERESLDNDNSMETFTAKGKFDYSLSRNWLVGGGGEFVYATSSTYENAPVNDQTNKSSTELNSFNIFTQMQLKAGTFRIVPQAIGTFTVEKVNPNTNDVLTGEGTNQAELGGWAMVDIALSEAYAYVGYRYQDDGRAHLMPWRIGDQFYVMRTLYVRGEVGGYFPVKDDKYAHDRQQRTTNVTNRVDGGSFRYYSVNPNLVEARVELGLNATPEFEVYGGASHTLAGESVAWGFSVYGGVRYSYGVGGKSVSPYSKDNVGYSDDVDAADKTEAEDAAATDQEERQTFRKQRRRQQFTPQLEEYNPKMFEKAVDQGKKKKAK